MKKKFVLGLTGGIATGKSAALAEFKKCGAAVLDADRIAREVVEPGRPELKKIAKLFGSGILKKDGTLDRARMADIVFKSEKKRKALEKIIHPPVVRALRKEIAAAKAGLVVADIPLLFEAGLESLVDKIAVVWVPEEVQFSRLMKRNGISESQADLLIRSQWPMEKKRAKADFVIDNSGPAGRTRKEVREIVKTFKEKY